MFKNFELVNSATIRFDGFVCDVVNVFSITEIVAAFHAAEITLRFQANCRYWNPVTSPPSFDLCFLGVVNLRFIDSGGVDAALSIGELMNGQRSIREIGWCPKEMKLLDSIYGEEAGVHGSDFVMDLWQGKGAIRIGAARVVACLSGAKSQL